MSTTTATNKTHAKGHTAKPDVFNGKKQNYEKFRLQCFRYIRGNEKEFETDEKKILLVTSYMKEGLAQVWADNFDMKHVDMDTGEYKKTLPTWTVFMESLTSFFQDTANVKEAYYNLLMLKQGKGSAEEYFQNFEALQMKAGVEKDEDLIQIIVAGLQRELAQLVMREQPKDFAEWKSKAIMIDNADRQFAEMLKGYVAAPALQHIPTSTFPAHSTEGVMQEKVGTAPVAGNLLEWKMNINQARKNGTCWHCNAPFTPGHMCEKKRVAQDMWKTRRRELTPGGGQSTNSMDKVLKEIAQMKDENELLKRRLLALEKGARN